MKIKWSEAKVRPENGSYTVAGYWIHDNMREHGTIVAEYDGAWRVPDGFLVTHWAKV